MEIHLHKRTSDDYVENDEGDDDGGDGCDEYKYDFHIDCIDRIDCNNCNGIIYIINATDSL